jgi:hypothetical protein
MVKSLVLKHRANSEHSTEKGKSFDGIGSKNEFGPLDDRTITKYDELEVPVRRSLLISASIFVFLMMLATIVYQDVMSGRIANYYYDYSIETILVVCAVFLLFYIAFVRFAFHFNGYALNIDYRLFGIRIKTIALVINNIERVSVYRNVVSATLTLIMPDGSSMSFHAIKSNDVQRIQQQFKGLVEHRI